MDFFREIGRGGEGGLNAELIRGVLSQWEVVTKKRVEIVIKGVNAGPTLWSGM